MRKIRGERANKQNEQSHTKLFKNDYNLICKQRNKAKKTNRNTHTMKMSSLQRHHRRPQQRELQQTITDKFGAINGSLLAIALILFTLSTASGEYCFPPFRSFFALFFPVLIEWFDIHEIIIDCHRCWIILAACWRAFYNQFYKFVFFFSFALSLAHFRVECIVLFCASQCYLSLSTSSHKIKIHR